MRYRTPALLLSAAVLLGPLLAPTPARSQGGMVIPSTGDIGTTGHFLACRTTSSSNQTTPYYDQQDVLRTWDCGAGKRPHKGVDILGDPTPGVSPVYASAAGTVWTAERGNGMGWRIVLRHGRDVGGNGKYTYTIYGHMGNCSQGTHLFAAGIVPGAQVSSGQLIGWQGDDSYPSGCVSRTHLHWEVRAHTTDVSNVFLATPASPDFYTGVPLTADSPGKVWSVQANASQSPAPTLTPTPTGEPEPTPYDPWGRRTDRRLRMEPSPTPIPRPTPTATVEPTPRPRPTPDHREPDDRDPRHRTDRDRDTRYPR